jgi:hypothetical protein
MNITFLIPGDCPSPPGIPVVQQLRRDVYQVTWDPSHENGAHIELYCLEGKIEGSRRNRREANFTSDTPGTARNEDNTAIEADDDSDSWVLYYNGTGMKYQYTFHLYSTNPLTVTLVGSVKLFESCLFIPEVISTVQLYMVILGSKV